MVKSEEVKALPALPPPIPAKKSKKVWKEELDEKTMQTLEQETRNNEAYYKLVMIQTDYYKEALACMKMKKDLLQMELDAKKSDRSKKPEQ